MGKSDPVRQADLFGYQQGNEFPLEIAAGDRVISLKRVESGQIPELGDADGFGDLRAYRSANMYRSNVSDAEGVRISES